MALFAGLSWMTTAARGPRGEPILLGADASRSRRSSWACSSRWSPRSAILEQRGASLGVTQPWQFFWASGALSSVLDNAPTYLTFASLALGVADGGSGALAAGGLGALAAHPTASTCWRPCPAAPC